MSKWVIFALFVVCYSAVVAAALWWGYHRFNELTRYRTPDGALWKCKRCRKPVIVEDGIAHCGCPPNPSPWEPDRRLTD